MTHEEELERRDVEIAKRVAQCGVLEDQLWSLREQLARAQRHRGAAVGLLRGALKDGALSGDYADLAARVLEQADALHADQPPRRAGSTRTPPTGRCSTGLSVVRGRA